MLSAKEYTEPLPETENSESLAEPGTTAKIAFKAGTGQRGRHAKRYLYGGNLSSTLVSD